MVENWTLGSENDHDTLYEQHNPDYIPPREGGPAVVVADSENGRIVEYQRIDAESGNATAAAADAVWERTWEWQDTRIQWPRDADRLPNGHTLIADTHGKRVVEVDQQGEVVWSVPVSHPYDVERLGTGPESAGGESARRLGLESRTADQNADPGFDPLDIPSDVVTVLVPSRIVNGVIFVSPVWMDRLEFAAALLGIGAALTWAAFELRWQLSDVGLRWPVHSFRRPGAHWPTEDSPIARSAPGSLSRLRQPQSIAAAPRGPSASGTSRSWPSMRRRHEASHSLLHSGRPTSASHSAVTPPKERPSSGLARSRS